MGSWPRVGDSPYKTLLRTPWFLNTFTDHRISEIFRSVTLSNLFEHPYFNRIACNNGWSILHSDPCLILHATQEHDMTGKRRRREQKIVLVAARGIKTNSSSIQPLEHSDFNRITCNNS